MNTSAFFAGAGLALLIAAASLLPSSEKAASNASIVITQTANLERQLQLAQAQSRTFSAELTASRKQLTALTLAKSAANVSGAKANTAGSKSDAGKLKTVVTGKKNESAATSKEIRLYIANGMTINEIADELVRYQIIDHPAIFIRLAEQDNYILAGNYTLPKHADPVWVLKKLTTP